MDETLITLRQGLDRIMLSGAANMDLRTYMRLYKVIHDYCVKCKASRSNVNHRGAHLLGEELYIFLDDYLKQRLQNVHSELMAKSDEEMIGFYTEQWKRYVAAAKYNEHLFRFLERHWIMREIDEGKVILEIYPLHLARWKEHILENENGPIVDVLKQGLEKDRAGVEAASNRIEEVTESLTALGIGGPGLQRQISSDSLTSWCFVEDAGQLEELGVDIREGS